MLRLVDLGVPMNEVTSDGEYVSQAAVNRIRLIGSRSMLDLMILFRRRLEEAEILFAAGACFGNPLAREELPSLSTPRQSDLVMDLAESTIRFIHSKYEAYSSMQALAAEVSVLPFYLGPRLV